MNGQDEPLTAQAGDTLLSRSSSGTLSLDSSITRVPSLEDYAQEQNSRSTQDGAEQLEADALLAQSNPTEQAPLCMDSGLQWDAAILTVMLEGSSGADVQGKSPTQEMCGMPSLVVVVTSTDAGQCIFYPTFLHVLVDCTMYLCTIGSGLPLQMLVCTLAGSKALQHMVSAWRDAPVTGTLSRKVCPYSWQLQLAAMLIEKPHRVMCTVPW